MKRIGLRTYVLFSFFLFAILIAVVTAGLWQASNELENTAINMNNAIESITAAQTILDRLELNRRRVLLQDKIDKITITQRRTQMRNDLASSLKAIELYIEGDEERDTVLAVNGSIDAFLEDLHRLSDQGVRGTQLYVRSSASFEQAVSDISHLIRINQGQAQDLERQAMQASMAYKRSSMFLWALFLVSSAMLLWMFSSLVSAPILRLREAIEGFALSKAPPTQPVQGLTEIKEIAEKFRELTLDLKRQNEQRLIFLAAVAHDIKNPLGAIQMSLDLMTDDGDRAPPDPISAVLKRQVRQLRRLVDDLLDATRVESGHLELQKAPHDLRQILGDCVMLFQQLSDNHEIKVQLPEAPMILECDMLRLSQVFNNILSNAIKYSPQGGAVNVSLSSAGDFSIVAIRDQGIGIEREEIGRIFEPFRRPGANHHQIAGVGLGLSSSRKIVEAHRGWIQVQSRKGQGSVFFVCLPRIENATRPSLSDLEVQFPPSSPHPN